MPIRSSHKEEFESIAYFRLSQIVQSKVTGSLCSGINCESKKVVMLYYK